MDASFRSKLLRWYNEEQRDLPWRRTCDPYAIWVSEIMLQQTRVTTAIPFFEAFLERFPSIAALSEAREEDLLRSWAGLGYYSRARNLQRGALAMNGTFPRTFDAIRALPGVGDYTAAAIASIAFNLPHAAVDGNVLRVITRLTNDNGDIGSAAVRKRLARRAQEMLDRNRPGDFNQALMELGATRCLPREPQCLICPVAELCEAREAGVQGQRPVKGRRTPTVRVHRTVFILECSGQLLLWQRPADAPRLAGFWELPEADQLHTQIQADAIGTFRHSITHHLYTFEVRFLRFLNKNTQNLCKNVVNCAWLERDRLASLPLSTTARKAMNLFLRWESS